MWREFFSLTCDALHLGLDCILHLHSESLITRGRNNIVRKFLSEEKFTHLFWIDSDIAFSADSVFRLLRADRDVAAGVYPMKSNRWPAEGLPAGMTQKEFEDRFTEYPFNPIGHGGNRVSSYADADGFVEVDEAPTGFMVIKRHVFARMMESYPELRYTAGRSARPSAGRFALAFLRLHGIWRQACACRAAGDAGQLSSLPDLIRQSMQPARQHGPPAYVLRTAMP